MQITDVSALKERNVTMKQVSELFHATLSGYEMGCNEILGEGFSAIMPYIINNINFVLDKENSLKAGKNTSTVERIKQIEKFYGNPDVATIYQTEINPDGTIKLQLDGCPFAKMGVHTSLRPDTVCPHALILSALLSNSVKGGEGDYYTVKECKLTECGTEAVIEKLN